MTIEIALVALSALVLGGALLTLRDAKHQYTKAKEMLPQLGKADWVYDHDWEFHYPCCNQPVRRGEGQAFRSCGNGPLTGDAIRTGDCGQHNNDGAQPATGAPAFLLDDDDDDLPALVCPYDDCGSRDSLVERFECGACGRAVALPDRDRGL